MSQTEPEHIIRHRKPLAALMSPMRQEVVDLLSQMGTVSVSELAAALNRPPDALYYHLRVLKEAGLIVEEGYRQNGKRQEVLIRTVSPNLKLQYILGDAGNFDSISAIVGAMLRLGIRDFNHAFQSGEAVVEGGARNLWAARRIAWLSDEDLEAVNRALEALAAIFSRRSAPGEAPDGRLCALTLLLTPLTNRTGDHDPAEDD